MPDAIVTSVFKLKYIKFQITSEFFIMFSATEANSCGTKIAIMELDN
jgi:hypothetical protein